MNVKNPSVAYLVNTLIDTCRDEEETFRAASHELRQAPAQSLLEYLARQRGEFSHRLEHFTESIKPDSDSVVDTLGILHRSWIHFSIAAASGNERAVLDACEREESGAEAEFRRALDAGLPPEVAVLVQKQCEEVKDARARIRSVLAEVMERGNPTGTPSAS